MRKNVLVFPCGSEIGLELHKSLAYSTHFNVIGGSSVDDHGRYVFANYIGDLPMVTDPDFTDKINVIVDEYEVDFIFPAHDSVVLKLAQEQAAGNLRCQVVTSSVETCEVARSKMQSYERFEGIIPTPHVYAHNELREHDFPVFLKPDVGQGSKGTVLAKNMADVDFYLGKDPSLLILENLPGKEYTIDCFTTKEGELVFCEGRVRQRIANGISVNSTSVKDDRFQALGQKINKELTFRGMWFFQVKEDKNGELVLMEIAPRVAGTMGLVRCRGVNLALLSLFDMQGYDVDVVVNGYDMTIDRALHNSYSHNIQYKQVYLDFDDTVIFEGKVNPQVMAFVFQCLNKGVKVSLITKHKDDLEHALLKHKLAGIFDEIVWIRDEGEKYLHVTEKEAIFIDDSFAERKKIHDECGIPVFDVHAVEGLMEVF